MGGAKVKLTIQNTRVDCLCVLGSLMIFGGDEMGDCLGFGVLGIGFANGCWGVLWIHWIGGVFDFGYNWQLV